MRVAATVKSAGQYVLGKFGVYVSHQPIVGGKEPVLGSFAPYETLNEIGGRSTYWIHDGYQHRSEPQYFDATGSRTTGVKVYVLPVRSLDPISDLKVGSRHRMRLWVSC